MFGIGSLIFPSGCNPQNFAVISLKGIVPCGKCHIRRADHLYFGYDSMQSFRCCHIAGQNHIPQTHHGTQISQGFFGILLIEVEAKHRNKASVLLHSFHACNAFTEVPPVHKYVAAYHNISIEVFFFHNTAVTGTNMEALHQLRLIQHCRMQTIPECVKLRIRIAVENCADKQIIAEIIIKKSLQNDLHGIVPLLSYV